MALALKESRDILQNKIYSLVVFVQIFIIIGAVGLVVVAAVASDPALMDPSLEYPRPLLSVYQKIYRNLVW